MCNFGRGPFEEHCWNYFVFGSMVKMMMLLYDISISISGGQFVWLSGTVCAILVKGTMRNIHMSCLFFSDRFTQFLLFMYLQAVRKTL